MPPIIGPGQTINLNQKFTLHVAAFAIDGVTPDVTSPLVVSTTAPSFAAAAVDPGNNRAVIVTAANAVGLANIMIGVAGTPNPLQVPVTVTAVPNLSRVEFVSADAPIAK